MSDQAKVVPPSPAPETPDRAAPLLVAGVKALGSLRLTVVLLFLSIVLVFLGTIAQKWNGIWTVVDGYFRCWVALIGGWFPFPGGWLLGTALLANLLVSHAGRIRVQARGPRMILGLATLAVGALVTWVVISHVFEAHPSESALSPSSRVTLQLMQGGGSAAVLFVGCWLVFRRKAGIVLLHTGVVILMFSELSTGLTAEEGMMTIAEGQKVSYVEDTRNAELVFVDPSDPVSDEVFAIPRSALQKDAPIRVEGLPIEVRPLPGKYFKNASLQDLRPGDVSPATQGIGLNVGAREAGEQSGVDTEAGTDLPAVYVKLTEKPSGRDLGTYLGSVQVTMAGMTQTVKAGGKEYRLALRFKRTYKPYSVYLTNFRFARYAGTDTPKDFSSFVRLEDPERQVVRDVRIWMNNPLRYRGDTLYQANWDHATEKGTVLQVVENRGWMAPYVACMIVAVGLFGQFFLHLLEFIRKRRTA